MNDLFPEIDFLGGELAPIVACFVWKRPVEAQLDVLREDMFQVRYTNRYSIDVGWYPSFNETGCFQLWVILNENWEQPVEKISTRSYHVAPTLEEKPPMKR